MRTLLIPAISHWKNQTESAVIQGNILLPVSLNFRRKMEVEPPSPGQLFKQSKFWIGVALSVSSSLFIGSSFIIKKVALKRLRKKSASASSGGYGYLKDWLWWSGLISMAFGELFNFVAYAFAPASVVSTLGVLSVLVTTILSSRFLKEKLNILGKVGCFLSAVGSTVIVLHAPTEGEIEDLQQLQHMIIQPQFLVYVVSVAGISLILIYHFRTKYLETSTKTLLIWIGVCSMIGSLSVMSVKGLGLAVMTTIEGTSNEFLNWLTYLCVGALIVCVAVQMNFLNKALDVFNTSIVTPIYYVCFTSCVILASGILFREFDRLPVADWVGLAAGFFTVVTAVFILNFCKDNDDFTLVNMAQNLKIVKEEDEDDDEYQEVRREKRLEVEQDGGQQSQQSESFDDATTERTAMRSPMATGINFGYGTQTEV